MRKIILYYFFCFLMCVNSFMYNNLIHSSVIKPNIEYKTSYNIDIDNIDYKTSDNNDTDNIDIIYPTIYSIKMLSYCPSYLEYITNFLNQENSELLVKFVTGFLTKVDGFGGYVLHSNDVIINCILNNDLIDKENKKNIILFFIKLSQYGDSTGSHILQFYHDLVNCLL